LLARHLHVHMQAKGTATSHHTFNNFWDIAAPAASQMSARTTR
jgi:hypothetical protein